MNNIIDETEFDDESESDDDDEILNFTYNGEKSAEQETMTYYQNYQTYNPNAPTIYKIFEPLNWESLSDNVSGIHNFEQKLDKIEWEQLLCNKPFDQLDYKQMFISNQQFKQELITFICNPMWIQKCASRLNMDFSDYQDLLMNCNVL